MHLSPICLGWESPAFYIELAFVYALEINQLNSLHGPILAFVDPPVLECIQGVNLERAFPSEFSQDSPLFQAGYALLHLVILMLDVKALV